MSSLGKFTSWVAAAVFLTAAPTKAGHIPVHHSKEQIETADIKFYERNVHARDLDTTLFDHEHRLIGRVLGNQQYYEHELHKWELHPGLFVQEHLCLSRVLEGDMLYHERHPIEPSTLTIPAVQLPPGNPGGTVLPGVLQPGGGNPDTDIHTSSVPEPASGVLAFTALIVGVYAAYRRSRFNTCLK
jgi:hypothetical protein